MYAGIHLCEYHIVRTGMVAHICSYLIKMMRDLYGVLIISKLFPEARRDSKSCWKSQSIWKDC